jgi:hypothetical protein
MIIEDIRVISLDGMYLICVEAWIDDRIQVSPATWEEPAEFKPGLCHTSFVVDDQPPTDPDEREAWLLEQDIDWIDVDLSEV